MVQVAAAHHVEAPKGVDAQGEGAVEDKILAEEVEAAMGGDHFDKEYCPPVYGGKDKHLQIFHHPDPVQIFSHGNTSLSVGIQASGCRRQATGKPINQGVRLQATGDRKN